LNDADQTNDGEVHEVGDVEHDGEDITSGTAKAKQFDGSRRGGGPSDGLLSDDNREANDNVPKSVKDTEDSQVFGSSFEPVKGSIRQGQ